MVCMQQSRSNNLLPTLYIQPSSNPCPVIHIPWFTSNSQQPNSPHPIVYIQSYIRQSTSGSLHPIVSIQEVTHAAVIACCCELSGFMQSYRPRALLLLLPLLQ